MGRGFWLAAFLSVWISTPLWACEDLLRTQLPRITSSNFKLSAGAERDLRMLGVSRASFQSFVEANMVFVVAAEGGGFWSVVFEPNIRHADRGFKISGRNINGVFYTERIAKAYRDDEMEYFKAVAHEHGIQNLTMTLRKPLLNCPVLMVNGWVRVKLWLKHRLSLKSVRALLESEMSVPERDANNHKKPRYLMSGLHTAKSYLQAVVAGDGQCPNTLITVFEVAR